MEDNYQVFASAFIDGLKPPQIYYVWQWADEFRYLSNKSSAEPGKWRTERTPYLKEIMECLSDNVAVNEVVFMKGAQVGGTECGNNWIAYTIDHSPGPMLAVQPSLDLAKRMSKQRISPLVEECESLRKKIGSAKTRESDNTILQKDFPGGTLILAGANSPAGLRSMPAKKLFLDEIDEYPADVGGQGDPVELAMKRANTFGSKKKVFKCSTPTVEGKSRIAEAFEQSDQRYFYVPCPECGHFQTLVFKNLKWPKGEPNKVYYQCESEECGYHIKNWQKTTILKRGEWRAHNANDLNKKIAGFHLNSLYSPVGWLDWEEIAADWLKIQKKKDPNLLKTFVNTILGETWKEKSEVPDWHRLYERREPYEMRKVPDGVVFITAGVDVQGDRFEVEVVGWGRNFESWSIDYRVITGDPSEESTWHELDALLAETFPLQKNEKLSLPIKMLGIDTGYKTQAVYNWVRNKSQTKVSALKGRDNLQMPIGIPKPVDCNWKGRFVKRGLKVWSVGVSLLKEELYGWLRQNAPTSEDPAPIGFAHFPEYDEEFFRQLTAEKLVTKTEKGYSKQEWEKHRERNEALDCRIYARAAASICGIDRFTESKWRELESQIGASVSSSAQDSGSKSETSSSPGIKRRRSSFL